MMKNAISKKQMLLFKLAKEAALKDIKKYNKRISKRLIDDNVFLNNIELIKKQNLKNV